MYQETGLSMCIAMTWSLKSSHRFCLQLQICPPLKAFFYLFSAFPIAFNTILLHASCSVEGSFTFPMQKTVFEDLQQGILCSCVCYILYTMQLRFPSLVYDAQLDMMLHIHFLFAFQKQCFSIEFGLLCMYIKTAHSSCGLVTYRFLFAVKPLSVRQC